MPFREIRHTADLMVEVESRTLSGLFEEALKALSFLYGKGPIAKNKKRKKIKIELKAETPEELLVSFLNEVIFLTERERVVFPLGKVTIVKESPSGLSLTASIFNDKIHPLIEIKSATYHNLKISKSSGERWQTKIIFDV